MNTSNQRDKDVLRIILIEGAVNILVLIAKVIVGTATGSLAILADALHSLTDIVNNIVAWAVIRLSGSPPDTEHPYGHRKFESLAVFILATLLAVLSFELAIHAINKDEAEIINSSWGLGIMLSVLVINISVSAWQHMWARRLNSAILHADASHTFSDALTTIVVIVGWQLSAMGYWWLDKACALAVSVLILYLAFKLFRRVYPILIDQFSIDPESLTHTIKSVDGVLAVIRVRSRWIGSDKSVDMVISVDPNISTVESHEIADKIESLIHQKYNVTDISIHVEPHNPP